MEMLKVSERAEKQAFYLLKAINKAQRRFHLFADGDRILVAVSGGKDSLTMLDLLDRRRRTSKESYTLIAAHILSDYHCGKKVPDDWLAAWCKARNIPLVCESIAVAERITQAERSHCFHCSWNRRKALFQLANRLGCNKIAFGHHADDLAETLLMNLLYSGRIDTLEAKTAFFGGTLTVIRPMLLIEERDIASFAQASEFPIEGDACPSGHTSRRTFIKAFLRQAEKEHHGVKRSIYHAMDRYRTTLERIGKTPKTL